MKTIILILLAICFSGKDIHAQNAWYHQQSNVSLNLRSVYFINQNTGWIAGDTGVILHTTNAGTNWIRQISNTNRNLTHIIFTDSLNGIAAGSSSEPSPFCLDILVILKTTDGGNNWIVLQNNFAFKLQDMVQSSGVVYTGYEGSDMQCYVSMGYINKTNNNGANWVPSISDKYGYLSISFIDSLTGWALGQYSSDVGAGIQKVIKTTDAGVNWNLIMSDTNDILREYNMKFFDENTGYKIGNFLKKTTDGGYNWFSTDSILTNNIKSYTFINPDTGWCIGIGGKVIRTNNGGNSWTTQTSNTGNLLNDIIFVNNETGYIVGTQGRILKTITGGLTGVTSFENQIPGSHILYQNYPNPFNPKTIINYELGIRNFVSLKIYDVLGNEVAELVNEKQNAGSYSVEFDGSGIASGVYFYRLETNNFSEIKKMILIK